LKPGIELGFWERVGSWSWSWREGERGLLLRCAGGLGLGCGVVLAIRPMEGCFYGVGFLLRGPRKKDRGAHTQYTSCS